MHHIDKDLQKNKMLKHALKKGSACTVMHVDAIYILFIILSCTYTYTYICNVQNTKLAQIMYFLYANTCTLQSKRFQQQTKAQLYARM